MAGLSSDRKKEASEFGLARTDEDVVSIMFNDFLFRHPTE